MEAANPWDKYAAGPTPEVAERPKHCLACGKPIVWATVDGEPIRFDPVAILCRWAFVMAWHPGEWEPTAKARDFYTQHNCKKGNGNNGPNVSGTDGDSPRTYRDTFGGVGGN